MGGTRPRVYEHATFSPDGTRLAAGSEHTIHLFDVETKAEFATIDPHTAAQSVAFSPDGRTLAIGCRDGWAELWDVHTGKQLANARGAGAIEVVFPPRSPNTASLAPSELELVTVGDVISVHRFDDQWNATTVHLDVFATDDGSPATLVFTRDGLFTGEEAAFGKVFYRLGSNVFQDPLVAADQLLEGEFYRSSLVDDFRSGFPLELSVDTAKGVGTPPSVEILDLPSGPVVEDSVQVRVRALSSGAGVKEIRLFNNGAAVSSLDARGMTRVAGEPDEAFERIFTVPLEPGVANQLRAEAIAERGRVRSDPAYAVIRHAGKASRPSLHLLAISLEGYADPDLALGAPHEDAEAIVAAFRRQEGRLFARVHATHLRDGFATVEGIDKELRAIGDRARPQDVVLMFFAGHGTMAKCKGRVEEDYHLLTHRASFSTDKLCREGLSMSRLTKRVREIQSNKKVLMIDACRSGGAAVAANVVTMRGASEQEAIMRLAHSEGLAILASSKDAQAAYEESSLGHGLFTYVILQGLEGRAAARGERWVTVASLVSYVGNNLPRISRKFGTAQEPTQSTTGSDFPLFIVEKGERLVEELGRD